MTKFGSLVSAPCAAIPELAFYLRCVSQSAVTLLYYSCRRSTAHRLFQSVDELKSLLDKLLNQGELVIKWHRQIKNKGNNAQYGSVKL